MPKIPTSLGTPAIPQAGNARRVASIDSSGQADALISGSRLLGTAFHRTAAGVQDLAQAYDALQAEQNKKEAKDWLNQLMQAKTNLLYGDGTADNPGYMNSKGDAAVKSARATSDQLDKLREQFLSKTSNKQVSQLYDAASSQLIAPDHEDILKHASQQNLIALDTTDDATIAAAQDQMAANPTSDQVVANSSTLIAGSVLSKLDRAGITDPIARNQAVIEAVSASKASAIQTALVRDPKSGAALYAKWKDQIQGTDQAKIEQSIVQAEDRQMRKEEHQVYMARQQKEILADQARTEWARKIMAHAADPLKNPDVSLEAIAADQRLTGPELSVLYDMQKSADAGEAPTKVSARTLSSILPNLTAPYGDPSKYSTYKEINDLMATGKLNKSDWSFAASIIDSGRTEEGQKLEPSIFAAIKSATGIIGHPDVAGNFPDERHAVMLQQWTQDLYNQIADYKKNNKNPQDLFNPDNKDYVLSPNKLNKYKIPMDDSMQYYMNNLQGGSDELPPPPSGSANLDAPVIANPNDPAFINLEPGSKFYKLDPDTNELKPYIKGKNTRGQQSGSTPAPTVTAPTGQ